MGASCCHFETIKAVVLARIAPRPPFAMAYTGGCARATPTRIQAVGVPLRDVLRFPGTAEKAVEIIQD